MNRENGFFVSILRAIFSTGRVFLINDDYSLLVENISGDSILNTFWFTALFWAVHVMAIFWFVLAVLSFFGRKFIEKLILLFKLEKSVYVICGANFKSLCLADSLISNKKRLVIIIDENANDDTLQKIQDLGAILIRDRMLDKGAIKYKILRNIGFLDKLYKKQIKLFLFEDDENYNLSMAKAITKEANKYVVDPESLEIFLLSNDKNLMIEMEETINSGAIKYNIDVINEADLAARQLMDSYPIIDTLDIDLNTSTVKESVKNFTMLLIGFGKIGREVLFEGLCNGQFVTSQHKPLEFKAIVVDKSWSNKSWKFRNLYPAIETEYSGISYHSCDANSNEFEDLLKNNIEDIRYIVIATEDDNNNLAFAKSIQNFMERNNVTPDKKVIAVYMENQANLLTENDEDAIYKHIKFFGEYTNIYNEKVIINHDMDNIARKIYEHYNETHGYESNWVSESLFVKNSNRSAAIHLKTKLKLMGYTIDKTIERSEMTNENYLDFYLNNEKRDEQLENLLHTEHLRWNAFHFTNGWVVYPGFSEDEISQFQNEKNGQCPKFNYYQRKDVKKRWHACLVSWEELPEISKVFCYNKSRYDEERSIALRYPQFREYQIEDLEQIMLMPKFLHYAGIKVRKINN